jgi:uncharacterized protein (DUF4415 family)
MKKPDPYLIDEDNPELSDEWFASARPATEVEPELVAWSIARKRGQRGPQKGPKKAMVSLRVNAEVLAAYKATGRGYQTRMAAVLEKGAKTRKLSA